MTVWESWQVIAFVGGIALLSALGIAKVLDAVEDWRQARQETAVPEGSSCFWCGERCADDDHNPYCSSPCGIAAERG